MRKKYDPFSLIAQLTREIRPSKLEEARDVERQKAKQRRDLVLPKDKRKPS